MENRYEAYLDECRAEIDSFPMFFAFNNSQLDEGLIKLGLKKTEKSKLTSVGFGGFIRKIDKTNYDNMLARHYERKKKLIEGDEDGNGFIYDMFIYELAAHEYSYTYDETYAIYAAGLTLREVYDDEKMLKALTRAKRDCLDDSMWGDN